MTTPAPTPPAAMAVELLPCPFCGQRPLAEPWHGGAPTKIMVSCPGLHPDGEIEECEVAPQVTGETADEAFRNWNRRATTPAEGAGGVRANRITPDWCLAMAEHEVGYEVGAGLELLAQPPSPPAGGAGEPGGGALEIVNEILRGCVNDPEKMAAETVTALSTAGDGQAVRELIATLRGLADERWRAALALEESDPAHMHRKGASRAYAHAADMIEEVKP